MFNRSFITGLPVPYLRLELVDYLPPMFRKVYYYLVPRWTYSMGGLVSPSEAVDVIFSEIDCWQRARAGEFGTAEQERALLHDCDGIGFSFFFDDTHVYVIDLFGTCIWQVPTLQFSLHMWTSQFNTDQFLVPSFSNQ
jgi:hypothetical protein